MGRFRSLDGLRSLAIIAVIWHHTTSGDVRFHRGFLGVDLFFVLSGFLITTLLLRERACGEIRLDAFYQRRACRILPAYAILLAICCVLARRYPLQHDLPYAALYLSNLVPMLSFLAITWSLSAEEQFYLIIPTLLKYGATVWLFVGLLLLSAIPMFGFFPSVPPFFRETTFSPILMGVILAHLNLRWLRHQAMPWIALAAVLITCSYPGDDISGFPRLAIQAAFALFLGTCVAREDHPFSRVLTWGPLARIGVVSYGMYLYHMLVMGVFYRVLPLSFPLFVLTGIGTWVVAEVSYRTVEQRFLRMKRTGPIRWHSKAEVVRNRPMLPGS